MIPRAAAVTLAAALLFLGSAAGFYKLGRSNGFNQGWDKGYIRGLENPQNSDLYQEGFEAGCTNAQNASTGEDDEILARCMESQPDKKEPKP